MRNVITKQDIKKLATRTELKQVEKNLRREMLRVEERVENLEEGQKRIEVKIDQAEQSLGVKIDKLTNTVVSFIGRVDNLETENEVGSYQIRELDTRITKLESSRPAA